MYNGYMFKILAFLLSVMLLSHPVPVEQQAAAMPAGSVVASDPERKPGSKTGERNRSPKATKRLRRIHGDGTPGISKPKPQPNNSQPPRPPQTKPKPTPQPPKAKPNPPRVQPKPNPPKAQPKPSLRPPKANNPKPKKNQKPPAKPNKRGKKNVKRPDKHPDNENVNRLPRRSGELTVGPPVTLSPRAGRQTPPRCDTMKPKVVERVVYKTETETKFEKVLYGAGLIALIALAAAGLAALVGYVVGWLRRKRDERKFLESVLNDE